MKDWKDKLGDFFRGKGVPPKDTVTTEQAQSAWNHFVTRSVLPAFQAIKSIYERYDGTTVDIQQAPAGERWVRLTWMVAPDKSTLALLPPSVGSAHPPRTSTVLIYTIMGDEPSGQTTAWCETRIPNEAGDLTSSSRVFREALGDYRRKDLTKDTIISNFVASYQRHVLKSARPSDTPSASSSPEVQSPSPSQGRTEITFPKLVESVPALWKVGDIILNKYIVLGILGEGGMGIVYKVHDPLMNIMAVKRPRQQLFTRQSDKENFIREAETWVKLNEHPHILRCYFVEQVKGIPCLFAEYANGGSLAQSIHERRLYQDEPERAPDESHVATNWSDHTHTPSAPSGESGNHEVAPDGNHRKSFYPQVSRSRTTCLE